MNKTRLYNEHYQYTDKGKEFKNLIYQSVGITMDEWLKEFDMVDVEVVARDAVSHIILEWKLNGGPFRPRVKTNDSLS